MSNEYTIADVSGYEGRMPSASDRMPSNVQCAGGSCRFIGQSDEGKPGYDQGLGDYRMNPDTIVQRPDIVESAPVKIPNERDQFPPLGPNIYQMNGTAVGYLDKVVDANEDPHTALMLQHNFDPMKIDVNLESETLDENGSRCAFNKTCGMGPQSKDGYTFYKDWPLFVGHIPGGFVPVDDDHVRFMEQGNTPGYQAMDRQLNRPHMRLSQQSSGGLRLKGLFGFALIALLIVGGYFVFKKMATSRPTNTGNNAAIEPIQAQ